MIGVTGVTGLAEERFLNFNSPWQATQGSMPPQYSISFYRWLPRVPRGGRGIVGLGLFIRGLEGSLQVPAVDQELGCGDRSVGRSVEM